MEPLLHLCSAFGLSGAAGLNAYIPLLTLGLMQNRGIIHLASPFDVLGQWWCIAIIVVLLIVEIVVDKVPGADHVNDVVMSFVRPTAGAIIFASQTGTITWVHPGVWVVIGLLMSGGVHAGKAMVRPVVNMGTGGVGAPVVSAIEDLVSSVVSIVAILVPILAVGLLVVSGWLLWKLFRRSFGGLRGMDQGSRISAEPIVAAVSGGAPAPIAGNGAAEDMRWGGGL